MNEVIKQLADQATTVKFDGTGMDTGKQVLDQQKFAELIIKECIICIGLTMLRDGHSTEHYKQSKLHIKYIKDHFGVE